ncbi:MAG TPA: hypothetical protein VMN82_02465 [Thermoanaerobaculia bacterium]|nr:hypothetical protein [Thermoanaerobaculia bacterium]
MKTRLAAAVLGAALAVLTLTAADAAPKTVNQLTQEAREAYDRGDKALFLKNSEAAARLRPGNVVILYNLACGQALNGQTEAALATLSDIAAHRVAMNLDADTDFDSIRATEGYKRVVAAMNALRKERVRGGATVAFTIPEKAVVPEGVAYDPATKSFFVASVNQGRIFRVGPDGKAAPWTGAGTGLKSPLGIAVDPKRRALWVVSESIPNMNGGREGDPPDSTLFEFDLDSGTLRRRVSPPAAPKAPHFDDLTVASDGRVYVNDGFNPRIYTLAPGASELAVWIEGGGIDSGTQGLALTPDGRALYASDYRGLYRIDVASKRVTPLPVPPDLALNGIDGLVSFDGSLVAIQNGIAPHRVSRLDLTPDGAGVARARILEMNNPAFDEPTLGTVVDGALYFTANNQGHLFEDPKKPPTPADLRDVVILRLPLK